MYFTENSFVRGKNEIIFQSDRASGEDKAPHEDPKYSIFRMNLDSGEIEQISDDVVRAAHAVTKTPEGDLIAYTTDCEVKALDTISGKTTLLYTERGAYQMASVPSIAPNRRYVAFCRNEVSEVADPLSRRELRRLQGALLRHQGWADHLSLSGWFGRVRRVQGYASGRAFPVFAGRFDAGDVLP